MSFEPIAVVGRGCALPGAADPVTFGRNVLSGVVSLGPAPEERWELPRPYTPVGTERPLGDVGGFVRDFALDPAGLLLARDELAGLDPFVHWVLHSGRSALAEAGLGVAPGRRAGLVLGILASPSTGMARFAESVWLGGAPVDPRNHFMAGLSAQLAARALGLSAGGYAVEAACASSLYALKLACDRLHDRSADLMLAGGVNGTDTLLLHLAFRAVGAMSPTGRSRPFQRDADGLLPAQGAAAVALMRLADARAAGTPVLGVISGIGLSNDGRAAGLLTPSEDGQRRAMRSAYASAGVDPGTVSLVECHATGTALGDAAEVRSMAGVFPGGGLPIGSVKANFGHSFAVAGLAGLLKILAAMEAGVRPPTPGLTEPLPALTGTGLRVVTEAEEWTGRRRAALSSFGFGGNNAHLVVDAGDPGTAGWAAPMPTAGPYGHAAGTGPAAEAVAVVAVGARVAGGASAVDLRRLLFDGAGAADRADGAAGTGDPARSVDVALAGLRFPPRDLTRALGQQTLVLEAAREAAAGLDLAGPRTMVVLGMAVDPEPSRFRTREHVAAGQADAVAPVMEAVDVLGSMPNLVVNRINSQLDLTGPGFAVLAEEASGVLALSLAAGALRRGEADAVVVGAVDAVDEPVHRAAQAALGRTVRTTDAAVALVLRRESDARRAGQDILALLEDVRIGADPEDRVTEAAADLSFGPGGIDTGELVGTAQAARGLLDVVAAVLCLRHQAVARAGAAAAAALDARTAEVRVDSTGLPGGRVRLRAGRTVGWVARRPARPHVYSGADRAAAVAAARAGREGGDGPARLVVLADPADLDARRTAAAAWLAGEALGPAGVAFRDRPVAGRLAYVFAGGISAYPEMGRELLLARGTGGLTDRPGLVRRMTGWAYGDPAAEVPVADRIWGSGVLSVVHARISRDVLGLRPDAVLGYSAGESAALVALGIWPGDVAGHVAALTAAGMFSREVAGEFRAVRRAWARDGIPPGDWATWLVGAPAAEVRAALLPGTHLVAVNAPASCVVGGHADRLAEVLARLPGYALRVPYDLAVHVPETREVRDEWRRLNRHDTVPGPRLYTCGEVRSYDPSPDACADALTSQAMGTMDFAATVRLAWEDGVRVFVEHGPRRLCTDWIGATLGDREHVAVALDGGSGVAGAVAELLAAGVPVDAAAYLDGLDAAHLPAPAPTRTVPVPVHLPALHLLPLRPAPATPVGAGVAVLEHRRIAEVHADFLARQAAVHERYLTLRAGLAGLVDPTGTGPADPARTRTATGTDAPARGTPAGTDEPAGELPVRAAAQRPVPHPGARPVDLARVPVLDRQQLEYGSTGDLSVLFGPAFAAQDAYRRQTRMPAPPMLLADRVTAIDAEPATMGTGSMSTETDVRPDSWYLDHAGRMPAGVMMEAGQADLLLISWLGVDLLNRGERVYRLLGAELTFHGPVAKVGETLRFDIAIDGHAEYDGIRLFFFRYDCHVGTERRLSLRSAQAGFFTDAELAGTDGLLWTPAADPPAGGRVDPPVLVPAARSFGRDEVRAFADGKPLECFGPGWEPTLEHLRTPRVCDGDLLLLDEVTDLDPLGGPWGRGYLRARTAVADNDWFFAGHFHNDPCMPGSLMFEGCFQAMSFYLAGLGCTLDRDGWLFEPVPERPYRMRCRGQVTPASRELVYEVFVRELRAGAEPELVADLVCTVDGLRAFHAGSVALRLVPDPDAAPGPVPPGPGT